MVPGVKTLRVFELERSKTSIQLLPHLQATDSRELLRNAHMFFILPTFFLNNGTVDRVMLLVVLRLRLPNIKTYDRWVISIMFLHK